MSHRCRSNKRVRGKLKNSFTSNFRSLGDWYRSRNLFCSVPPLPELVALACNGACAGVSLVRPAPPAPPTRMSTNQNAGTPRAGLRYSCPLLRERVVGDDDDGGYIGKEIIRVQLEHRNGGENVT
ncbi:hypothetical protein C0Q70_17706 [Pomacea canaliculata]|uniref:Uncharacterized protein n=1 Tax=Pomacea canaliculata TaxID=400727 RepID=A0A2T7NL58_POMCA|nr:hypothetical protein C0Q70_17706 [Pomacea canaliculata]